MQFTALAAADPQAAMAEVTECWPDAQFHVVDCASREFIAADNELVVKTYGTALTRETVGRIFSRPSTIITTGPTWRAASEPLTA